jgi:uncharacterized protein YndB with AHSA1/START domain
MRQHRVSVERLINAPAAQIFALVADAGLHASFDGSETVVGARLPSQPLTLGSTFGMSMRGRPETLFLPYRTTNTVIEFVPDRLIAWQTWAPAKLIGGRIWRYELTPQDGGTLVRETWDTEHEKYRSMVIRGSLPRKTEDAMRATLDRIAKRLEA